MMGLEWKGDEDEGKKVNVKADALSKIITYIYILKKILRNADLIVLFFSLCP